MKNNSEYRLLPGPVSIILDDSYVSKTTISVRLLSSFPVPDAILIDFSSVRM